MTETAAASFHHGQPAVRRHLAVDNPAPSRPNRGPDVRGRRDGRYGPAAGILVGSMTDQPTFLTPSAYRKLQEELEHLKTVGRREVEERIAEARSHGDIRENADYDAAKNEQGLMEARIRQLEHLLHTAEVREAEDTGEVVVGSVVKVRDSDGDELTYFVAPPENKVPGYLLASPSSPVGEALLGARPGDTVTYEAPGGTFTLEVLDVQPYRD